MQLPKRPLAVVLDDLNGPAKEEFESILKQIVDRQATITFDIFEIAFNTGMLKLSVMYDQLYAYIWQSGSYRPIGGPVHVGNDIRRTLTHE